MPYSGKPVSERKDRHEEDDSSGLRRDGTFAKMIEAAQGSDIDTVSGATITTAGVKQAVDDALGQAAETSADQAKSSN